MQDSIPPMGYRYNLHLNPPPPPHHTYTCTFGYLFFSQSVRFKTGKCYCCNNKIHQKMSYLKPCDLTAIVYFGIC